jgi:hypothetical protein
VWTHERWGLLLDAFAFPQPGKDIEAGRHRAEEVPAVPFGPDRLGQKQTDALVLAAEQSQPQPGLDDDLPVALDPEL